MLNLRNLLVYPNPSHSKINIINLQNQALGDIEINDILGNVLIQLKENSRKTEIDISSYSPGIYFVKCDIQNKLNIIKFIKL